MLPLAVVIARDRARADVDAAPDRRVAKIGQVVRLRAGAEHRLLELDEVADARVLPQIGAGPQVRERADDGPRGKRGLGHHTEVEHRHAIGKRRVDDAHASMDRAPRADGRLALEEHAGMDRRPGPDPHGRADVGGVRIDDGDAGGGQGGKVF